MVVARRRHFLADPNRECEVINSVNPGVNKQKKYSAEYKYNRLLFSYSDKWTFSLKQENSFNIA